MSNPHTTYEFKEGKNAVIRNRDFAGFYGGNSGGYIATHDSTVVGVFTTLAEAKAALGCPGCSG